MTTGLQLPRIHHHLAFRHRRLFVRMRAARLRFRMISATMADADLAERDRLRAERQQRLEEADTIVNEQMQRSREIEAMGVEQWKASQDQRPPEERPAVCRKISLREATFPTRPFMAEQRVPGITHPIAETPQRAPVRNPDGSIPR